MVPFPRNCWFCTSKVEDIMQKYIAALAACSGLVCGLQATTSPNMGQEPVVTFGSTDQILTSTVRLADYFKAGVDTDYGHKQVVWNPDGTYNIQILNGDQTESFAANAQSIVALLNRLVGVSGGNLNPDDYQRIMSELGQIQSSSSGSENTAVSLLRSMVEAQAQTTNDNDKLPQEAVQSTFPMAMPQQQPAVEKQVEPSSTETANLTQRNEELAHENADLKNQVEAQQAEIEQLKAELAKLKQENK